MFGLILAAAASASAAGPAGNKLKWLPYRPSSGDADGRVTVAARDTQPRPDTSYNPVRQAQASPFDNPFGDARSGSQRAQPVAVLLQAGSGTGKAPATQQVPQPGLAPAATPAPSAKDQPQVRPPAPAAGAASDPVAAPAGSGGAAGQAAPSSPPQRKQDTPEAPGGMDLPGKEKSLEGKCRSLKELPSIAELNNSMGIDTKLPIAKDGETPEQRRARKREKDKVLRRAQTDVAKYACPLGHDAAPARETIGWQPITFTWKASGLCHKPLYFEQAHVERYGHSTGPITQPLVSAGMFFLTVPILPYEMGLYPPCECIYTLGYYRPGSCAPYYLEPVPLSLRAGLIEAGAVLGAIYILP